MSRSAIPELAWWYEDPERWELLEFDGQSDEDGLPADARWEDRQQVLEALVQDPEARQGDFARYLLVQETRWHGHCWGFCHSIEIAALLVAQERQVDDVWLLWAAVCRSFDTWCGLPHRLLLAAGVARTVGHVSGSDHPQRDNLLEHLRGLPASTDGDVEREIRGRLEYYNEVLGESAGR
ncbi:hypothetical protein GCM10010193_17750 [Kitasatospora atroaurantiaca]|uniref:Uncharacterized protein n=1 Tax=Kitasatospora atroaurantiaca TaxID=285545 RepID=A0A561EJN2_9ACTN|nr:hypothetical protein [Kitasatospora atroaurantiaca]TWE15824.1 hypothetical protein FB465_0767 [Kitasatospora atroaurantiaca]